MASRNTATAILRNVRVSPRKLNLVAQLIRGKDISRAADVLTNSPKRVSQDAYKTLMSAVANAENNHGMDIDRLIVQEAYVGQSFVMKRFHARAKGRGAGIKKPFSHLTIIVREKEV
ncbi:MAG: 50S ribosomal protein L22 [Alphaproteobacteria bacterium]|nr:50S ribosomal protein L22 [Alphaproteobacteria bacterium]